MLSHANNETASFIVKTGAFPFPVKLAGLKFIPIILTFISSCNRTEDDHLFQKTFRIEDLGFYVGNDVTFVPKNDLAIHELGDQWKIPSRIFSVWDKFRRVYYHHKHSF